MKAQDKSLNIKVVKPDSQVIIDEKNFQLEAASKASTLGLGKDKITTKSKEIESNATSKMSLTSASIEANSLKLPG